MKEKQTMAARDSIAALRGIIFETVIGEPCSGDPAAEYSELIKHYQARPGKGIGAVELLRGLAGLEAAESGMCAMPEKKINEYGLNLKMIVHR